MELHHCFNNSRKTANIIVKVCFVDIHKTAVTKVAVGSVTHHDSVLLAVNSCWCILCEGDGENGSAALMNTAKVHHLHSTKIHAIPVSEWRLRPCTLGVATPSVRQSYNYDQPPVATDSGGNLTAHLNPTCVSLLARPLLYRARISSAFFATRVLSPVTTWPSVTSSTTCLHKQQKKQPHTVRQDLLSETLQFGIARNADVVAGLLCYPEAEFSQ